jgi:hypothetical protein
MLQRLVNRDQVRQRRAVKRDAGIERHLHGLAATLRRRLLACEIDQHAPHRARRHREKIGSDRSQAITLPERGIDPGQARLPSNHRRKHAGRTTNRAQSLRAIQVNGVVASTAILVVALQEKF